MSNFSSSTSLKKENDLSHFQDSGRIYLAEVMDARDPKKIGDLKVWVINSGTAKENPENWVVAHCCSVYGTTYNSTSVQNSSYSFGLTSFGNWFTMPYVGNYVFIFYPNVYGSSSIPYWFGSPLDKSNNMLPGIAYDLNQTKDFSPKCEVNYKNENTDVAEYVPLKIALEKQGLDKDRLRGISTASSFRDIPSHCYGFLSPLGNQMVIDDGWSTGDSNINWINDPRSNNFDNQDKDDYGLYFNKKNWIASVDKSEKDNKLNRFHGGFRFRTRHGTQILILDSGNIYMINKDGTAWAELSEDGYIDCYSQNGVNAASDGDINLHGLNINIESLNKVSIKAGSGVSIETDGNVMVKSGSVNISDRVSVPYVLADEGQIGVFRSPLAEITGTFSGTLQGTAYYATAAGFTPIEQQYPDITPMTSDIVKVTDTVAVKQQVDAEEIYTITTRVPTHEPWAGHDRNENIPDLVVKQQTKKAEKEKPNNTVASNQVRS